MRQEGPATGAGQVLGAHLFPARLSAAPRMIAAGWGEGSGQEVRWVAPASGAPLGHKLEGELWESLQRLAFGLSAQLGYR